MNEQWLNNFRAAMSNTGIRITPVFVAPLDAAGKTVLISPNDDDPVRLVSLTPPFQKLKKDNS